MTDLNKAEEIHGKAADLLRNEQLLGALNKMSALMEEAADWNLRSEFENLQSNYRRMLQFIGQGMEDPERGAMYMTMKLKGLELNDRLLRAVRIQFSTTCYYKTLREVKKNPHLRAGSDLAEWARGQFAEVPGGEVLPQEYIEAQLTLFNALWTSDIWSSHDREELAGMLDRLPEPVAALSVSAVTLGLLEMFDLQKFHFLIEAYSHPAATVNQRAVAGVALAGAVHDNRMLLSHGVQDLLADAGGTDLCNDLHRVQMQLLCCRETEKISKFMNEEFIPEMMKNPMLKKDKTGLDSIMTDEEAVNPEWEKWMESKAVRSKIHTMNEFYTMGADVHMASFAHMKNFPFFREVANWFLPFDRRHPAIASASGEDGSTSLFRELFEGSEFCDSDCYSIYLFLASMPGRTRNVVDKHVPNVSEEVREHLREMALAGASKEVICKKYARNVYRFYKLFSRRHEFTDLFEEEELNLQYCTSFLPLVNRAEYIEDVAMYLFNQKHYEEADIMFDGLEMLAAPTFEVSQKRGFCMQQLKQYAKAVEHYENADLMHPDNLWTLTHLAQCYSHTEQLEKAAKCYLKAEAIAPEDLTLQLQTGNCLAKLGQFDEAFKRFFKIHYLDEKSVTVLRAIAWFSLMAGKPAQAEHFYTLIEESGKEPTEVDLLNIGHTHWLARRYDKAAEYYLRCYRLTDLPTFHEMLLADANSLLCMGINPMDVPLILDLVTMKAATSEE